MEGAALAVLAREGQCTSYRIARAFADSPSEFWSGSVGAVYPMLKRLQARGLISAKAGVDGARVRTSYALTRPGRAAFEGWLLNVERATGLGFDPLRTRAMELDLVSAAAARKFLRAALARTKALIEDGTDDWRTCEGAVRAAWLQARATWLEAVLQG